MTALPHVPEYCTMYMYSVDLFSHSTCITYMYTVVTSSVGAGSFYGPFLSILDGMLHVIHQKVSSKIYQVFPFA